MKKLQKQVRVTPRDSRSLENYFHDIAHMAILSSDEEAALAKRIHAGDEKALEKLVLGNLRFVVSVAKHYLNHGLELSDLISAGNIGLITAAQRFDETLGNRFCSYAVWWIRQSILQSIAKDGRTMSLPANQLAMLTRINRESARLEQKLGRTPSRTELTEWLDTNDNLVDQLLRSAAKPLSLNDIVGDDEDGLALIDTIADTDGPCPDDALMQESLHDDVATLLSDLSPNERKVVKMSFGIDHTHAFSMDEIAYRLRLSRERVRQIHGNAILRLQRNPKRELLREYL